MMRLCGVIWKPYFLNLKRKHMKKKFDKYLSPHNSRPLSRRTKNRGRPDGALKPDEGYFVERPTFNRDDFRRIFRMCRILFNLILGDLQSHNPYFRQQPDTTCRYGLIGEKKMTSTLRMLAYGSLTDAIDEYIRIGQITVLETLGKFCMMVCRIYAPRYLKTPIVEDIARLSTENAARGFSGCLGSVDCMHWEWKNCPTGWHGQFTRHVPKLTIILEVIASHDTWIWHSFFGMPGSCNDLNVLQKSDLFQNLLHGKAPPVEYSVNRNQYHMDYYLADGIYPPLATIVQAFREPMSPKKVKFTQQQQSCRKDVERDFGILQARWRIVAGPSRFWDPVIMHLIMMTCITLHNMIVEDELREPDWVVVYDQRGSITLADLHVDTSMSSIEK